MKHSIDHLLEGCRAGERRAQESLYRLLAPELFGICMRYAATDFEAEEILQTGFIKVFKHVSSFREEGSFEGWIRKIMINTAIQYYHQSQHGRRIIPMDETHEIAHDDVDMNNLNVKDLLTIIRKLPEGYRLVFNMYAIEGFSHKEIAAALHISESASKSQLSRARTWLKKKITIMEGGLYGINAE